MFTNLLYETTRIAKVMEYMLRESAMSRTLVECVSDIFNFSVNLYGFEYCAPADYSKTTTEIPEKNQQKTVTIFKNATYKLKLLYTVISSDRSTRIIEKVMDLGSYGNHEITVIIDKSTNLIVDQVVNFSNDITFSDKGRDIYHLLKEPMAELDLSISITNNRLFMQVPESIASLLQYVYEKRARVDEDNFFSDTYIPRETTEFFQGNLAISNVLNCLNRFWLTVRALSQIFKNYTDAATGSTVQLVWPSFSFGWPHLLYAYLVENTKVYEIFFRVLHEFRHSEKLGVPSSQVTQRWLLNTEQLFYNDPPSYMVQTLTSYTRPDLRATRRNAYYRMFGMDLNHGTEDNRPYPYIRPEAANKEFVNTFEEFIKEVWVGIENAKNESGSDPTDDGAIVNLATRLQATLNVRREQGNLSREEFFAVATMSWFHLTLLYDSEIVKDLRANARTPDQRLRTIGARVGIPAHAKAYHFFQLADCVSVILYAIEAGFFNEVENAHLLYAPEEDDGEPREYLDAMQSIVTHWSAATGRDMKMKGLSGKKS